jgi:hypothetical protein
MEAGSSRYAAMSKERDAENPDLAAARHGAALDRSSASLYRPACLAARNLCFHKDSVARRWVIQSLNIAYALAGPGGRFATAGSLVV